ncbi:hypothetical protein [Paracoccus sp. SCSIO 75233]|uniref:hypothetical protein n=1 Tax=Paracoccus sp. SCSIO 75233 TaxID=3017782 RepID=UPI0022F0C7DF|nr:hypothetical protein [Paracoccus sp. SCSIO 75233]WBU53114.1 hypothetical protein PAF12_15055 [Paracoccus sp. SCSIO 75233]
MENDRECLECRNKIDLQAKICIECGSYQDLRRHIKTWTPALGFILAFIAFLFSIFPQIRSAFFPSPPKISVSLSSVSERSVTFYVSNLGERRLMIDPLLKCVAADQIDERVVDYEEPFRVLHTTVEGQLDRPITVSELGGSELATFDIPAGTDGTWLESKPVFLSPEDERVSGISRGFSNGMRHTWFEADRSSKIPTYHIVGEDGLISLQPVSEIATFCQLNALDPASGMEVSEGIAIWQVGNDIWQGGQASKLYNVTGSLIYIGGPGGLSETDPNLCGSEFPPWGCVTAN